MWGRGNRSDRWFPQKWRMQWDSGVPLLSPDEYWIFWDGYAYAEGYIANITLYFIMKMSNRSFQFNLFESCKQNILYNNLNQWKNFLQLFWKSLLTFPHLYNIICLASNDETKTNNEVWLSLVERCVRDAEAAGSSPVTSTKLDKTHI